MYNLKLAVFSLRDVILSSGELNKDTLDEVVKLLKFLISKGIQPVIISNSIWTINPSKITAPELLSKLVGVDLPYYQGGKDIPFKQHSSAIEAILSKHDCIPQEAVYVGSTTDDMRSARNGKLLFLNADWHAENSEYGFHFENPKDIARFIDCCCLGVGDWFWSLEQQSLRVYSIGPLAEYSRRYPEAAMYSADAKKAVKFDRGNLSFWGRLMAARIHFSGIGQESSYVCPYPGHKTDSNKMILTDSIKIVSGSLSAQYLHDFIVRHTNAQKSQTARQSNQPIDHTNQLNTIHLRRDPLKTGPLHKRYKKFPSIRGKTVLVIDDICTQGFSLEAARAFFESKGAHVICITWLKTPGNNDYQALTSITPNINNHLKPYTNCSFTKSDYSYNRGIKNNNAPIEIATAFDSYEDWDWPNNL